MGLILTQRHKSITQINNIELCDFVVFVGVNWAWKSHILEAIKEGKIQYNSFNTNEIVKFSFEDFLIKNQQKISKWTIETLRQTAWNNLSQRKLLFQDIDKQIKSIYNKKNPYEQTNILWNYVPLVNRLTSLITQTTGNNQTIKALLFSGIYNSWKFASEINEDEFYEAATFDEFDYSLITNLSQIFMEYAVELTIKQNDYNTWKIDETEVKEFAEKSPWMFINRIFEQFGLLHQITFPKFTIKDLVRKGNSLEFQVILKLWEEQINFESLSSGERILCALAMTIFQNSKTHFPKVILLDEIDAFLHPSMIKNLITVIKNVFLEKWCKIILTTHSPTTVALIDEDHLFEIQKGNTEEKIKKISQSDAIDILSEGYATLSGWKIIFENIINSKKDLILFTEWPTDITHIQTAKEKLGITTDFDIFHCRDAWRLSNFLKWIPNWILPNTKKIIGIFDFDNEWRKGVNIWIEIEKDKHYTHSEDWNIHAITLPVTNNELIKTEYCPIEFLYPQDKLQWSEWLLTKKHLREINSLKSFESSQIWQSEYEAKNDLYFFKVSDEPWKKTKFTDFIKSLDQDDFKNFQPLFDMINEIKT